MVLLCRVFIICGATAIFSDTLSLSSSLTGNDEVCEVRAACEQLAVIGHNPSTSG